MFHAHSAKWECLLQADQYSFENFSKNQKKKLPKPSTQLIGKRMTQHSRFVCHKRKKWVSMTGIQSHEVQRECQRLGLGNREVRFHWTSKTSLCKYPKMNVSPSHKLYFNFFFLKGKPLGLQTSKSYLLNWHHCYTITVELKQSEQVKAFLHSTPSLTLGTYSPLPQHHTNSPVYFDSNGVSGQPDGSASKAQQR